MKDNNDVCLFRLSTKVLRQIKPEQAPQLEPR
jgi:hypothetical protein